MQAATLSSAFDEDRTGIQKPTVLYFSGDGRQQPDPFIPKDSVPCHYGETINKYHN
jgi:hypothetical protein